MIFLWLCNDFPGFSRSNLYVFWGSWDCSRASDKKLLAAETSSGAMVGAGGKDASAGVFRNRQWPELLGGSSHGS